MRPKQLFFFMLGLLALVIGGSCYLYYSVNNRLEEDISKISAKLVEREAINAEARAITETNTEYAEIIETGVQDKLADFLPDSKTQEGAIGELFDLFSRSGIPLQNISFEGTDALPAATSQSFASPTPGVFSMNVAVGLKGAVSYNKFYRLLQEFEDANRHFTVHAIQASRSTVDAEGNNGEFVNVTLAIYIHYQGEAAVPAVNKEELLKQLEESTGQTQ